MHANTYSSASSRIAEALDIALEYIAKHRDEYHLAGRLDDETVRHFQDIGIYRALVPRALGGDEMHPVEFLRLVEQIAIVDGSAGWVASIGSWKSVMAALPATIYAEIHADGPDVVTANAGFPFEPARAVDGGYRITGRRFFSSGVSGAAFVVVGIVTEHGENRLAVLPRSSVSVIPDWNVIGLRGTGSYEIVVDDVLVPEAWTFVRGTQPDTDNPLHCYPVMILSAQAFAVVGLGVARAALDILAELAKERASLTGGPLLAERAHVQIMIAEETAALQSARAWFYEQADRAAEMALSGNVINGEQRTVLRLSATHAASTAAKVARRAFEQAGTAGVRADHPLARRMQDAMMIGQHAMLNAGTWQSAGQSLLGLDPPRGYP